MWLQFIVKDHQRSCTEHIDFSYATKSQWVLKSIKDFEEIWMQYRCNVVYAMKNVQKWDAVISISRQTNDFYYTWILWLSQNVIIKAVLIVERLDDNNLMNTKKHSFNYVTVTL